MKKTILFIFAIGLATSGAFAQAALNTNTTANAPLKAPLSDAEKAKRSTDKINAEANLSADQRSKVYDILNDYYTKLTPIKKADAGQHTADTKTKVDALKSGVLAKLQVVLTADQLTTVKAMFSKPEDSK